jgi:hypothetical protein
MIMKLRNGKKNRELDAGILQSIEGRRNHLYENYNLPPDQRMRAELLFAEMERLGRECRSVTEFEHRFHNRTLSRELYDIMLDNGYCLRSTWTKLFPETPSTDTPASPAPTGKPAVSDRLRKLFGGLSIKRDKKRNTETGSSRTSTRQ